MSSACILGCTCTLATKLLEGHKSMEVSAINHDGPQIVNSAYALHVKHNRRIVVLEVSAAN